MANIRNIPQLDDELFVSQGQLLDNFAEISTFVDENHIEFNHPDQGNHFLLDMYASDFNTTVPNANNQEIILGNQLDEITNHFELTLKRNNETISILTSKRSGHDQLTNINKQVRLFSGLLLKFDLVPIRNASGQVTANFSTAEGYVPFTEIYNVFISNYALNGQTDINVRLMSFNTTSVTVFVTERTTNSQNVNLAGFSILAIGV